MSTVERTPFRLLTNFRSPTCAALQEAGRRLGGEVLALDDLADLQAIRTWNPLGALVFMYGSPHQAEATVDLLQRLSIPVAVWQVDDPGYLRREELRDVTIRIARKCDLYFSHTTELQAEYASLGIALEYLPTGARRLLGAEALCGPPPRDAELDLDYVFVCTVSPERRAALSRLQAILPDSLRGGVVTGVDPVEALRLQRHARVSLFLGAHTGTGGIPDGWGLSERSWEVPLVGGLLLQEDRVHMREHFRPGFDAVAFQSLEECAERLIWLCRHPQERRAIAERAQARVLREHMLEHRLVRIIDRLRAVAQRKEGA